MRKLLKDNYEAIKARGLITENTSSFDFISKLHEETREVYLAMHLKNNDNLVEEITDCINVLNNWLVFMGFDPDKELEKCLQKNVDRIKK